MVQRSESRLKGRKKEVGQARDDSVQSQNNFSPISETSVQLPSAAGTELRHIRYFIAVAELKSFTRASERLKVSQPTLSHQIKQLESRLGTVLFHRFARSAELTPAGHVFKVHGERILQELGAGVRAVSDLEGLVRGTLRMAVFHSFATSLLGPVLASFALKYPGVHVTARLLPRMDMERDLRSGALDLAIAYVSEDTEHIDAEILFEEELILIVGRGHSLATRGNIRMRSLAELDLVLLTQEFAARQYLDRFFAKEKLTQRIVLEMNAVEPILSTIRDAPLGTVLPAGVIGRRSGLHPVRLVQPTPRRSVAVLWRREAYRSAAATRMAEMIRGAYRIEGKVK